MRARLPPKKAFPHLIEHGKLGEKDDWGKPIISYKEIKFVRFDAGFNFSRSGKNATEKMPNALITMFDKYCGPLPDFKTEDLIKWNDEDYVIVTVVPLYFDSGERFGYELEVV